MVKINIKRCISFLLLFAAIFLVGFFPKPVYGNEIQGNLLNVRQKIEKTGQVPNNLDERLIYTLRTDDEKSSSWVVKGNESIKIDLNSMDFVKPGIHNCTLTVDKPEGSQLNFKRKEYHIEAAFNNRGEISFCVLDIDTKKKVSAIDTEAEYKGVNPGEAKTGDSMDALVPSIMIILSIMCLIFVGRKSWK